MISIATLLLLSACTQTDLSADGSATPNGPTPLQVDNIVLETATATRATTAALETDGAEIGIFRTKGTNYDAAQNNVLYTYNTSGTPGWTPATTPVWLLGYTAQVCAYYPYNSGNNTSTAIPLATALYTPEGDICFDGNREMNGQSATESPTANRSTIFAMKRVMAKMQITLKRGDYPGTCTVSQIMLANTNLPATGAIDITKKENTATVSTTQASFSYTPLSEGSTSLNVDGSEVDTQELLLIPFTPSGDVDITLTVDTKDMKLSLPATTFSATNGKIEAGKFYKLTLLLNGTALLVSSVSTEDWTEVPQKNGPNGYEPVPGDGFEPQPLGIRLTKEQITLTANGCTEDDKALLSILTWAEGNLISKGTDNYDWASTQEQYGYYYPFMSTYHTDGYTGSENIDPCSKLKAEAYGTGWRTPTGTEITALSRCTDNLWVTTSNGTKGMWFMAPFPNGLFLPGAGYRADGTSGIGSGTVGTKYPGNFGFYWSSDANGSQGYCLRFNYAPSSTSISIGQTEGASVRCVKSIGIKLSKADITLTANGCTEDDKDKLSKLRWAEGNLKSTGNENYDWALTQEDYGYYYPFMSLYNYDGYTGDRLTDPCSKLKADVYGSGWRTPTDVEMETLSRCTDKLLVTRNSVCGMWFMASEPYGLFLPAAGTRGNNRDGSGIKATKAATTNGVYWSSFYAGSGKAYTLQFSNGAAEKVNNNSYNCTMGFTVRCVHD